MADSCNDQSQGLDSIGIDDDHNERKLMCKICLRIGKDQCYLGPYCQSSQSKPDMDTLLDEKDQIVPVVQASGIYLNEGRKNCISLLEDFSKTIEQVVGEEAITVAFFNTNPNEKYKVLPKPGLYDKNDKKKKKSKNVPARYKYPMKKKTLHCPEECNSPVFQSEYKLIRHLIEQHRYSIVYYDQPIRLKLTNFIDKTVESDKKVVYKCIVKYMFKNDKYFLLDICHEKIAYNVLLVELTVAPTTNYQFQIQPLNMASETLSTQCNTLSDYKTRNINSVPVDNEYCLFIRANENTEYSAGQLTSRPGCKICYASDETTPCIYRTIAGKNFDNFQDRGKIQRINELVARENKYKIWQQSNFSWEICKNKLEYMSIVYLTITELKINDFQCQDVDKMTVMILQENQIHQQHKKKLEEIEAEIHKVESENKRQQAIIASQEETIKNLLIIKQQKLSSSLLSIKRKPEETEGIVINNNPQHQQQQQNPDNKKIKTELTLQEEMNDFKDNK